MLLMLMDIRDVESSIGDHQRLTSHYCELCPPKDSIRIEVLDVELFLQLLFLLRGNKRFL